MNLQRVISVLVLALAFTGLADAKPVFVSVVLPVYNGMPFLPRAVESVLNQTETR